MKRSTRKPTNLRTTKQTKKQAQNPAKDSALRSVMGRSGARKPGALGSRKLLGKQRVDSCRRVAASDNLSRIRPYVAASVRSKFSSPVLRTQSFLSERGELHD